MELASCFERTALYSPDQIPVHGTIWKFSGDQNLFGIAAKSSELIWVSGCPSQAGSYTTQDVVLFRKSFALLGSAIGQWGRARILYPFQPLLKTGDSHTSVGWER